MSGAITRSENGWQAITLIVALVVGCGGKSEASQPEGGNQPDESTGGSAQVGNCFGPTKGFTVVQILQEQIRGCTCDSRTDASVCVPDGGPMMFACFEDHWALMSEAPCPK